MKTVSCLLSSLLCSGLLLACGGDEDSNKSGQERSKAISTLTATESNALCTWAAEVQGGAGTTHECGDDVTITVESAEECVSSMESFTDCPITVGEFEDCSLALADNPCGFGGPACAPLLSCL